MIPETPKFEQNSLQDALALAIKSEAMPKELDTVPTKPASSGASLAGSPTQALNTPDPVKTEPDHSPTTASLAHSLSIAIPTAIDGNAASSTSASAVAAAILSSGAEAAQSSLPAHMHHPIVATPAISPLSDVAPTKRSRTPETAEEASAEKRQKTEHNADQQSSQENEAKTDADANIGILSWDLGAQLSSVLDSIEADAADEATAPTEDTKVDTMPPPIPLLPPPRKRLEKMKFIENPTYFSRAMGLPMLGSLVSAKGGRTRSNASLTHF